LKSTIEIGGLKVEPGSRGRGILEAGPYFPHLRAKVRRWAQIPFTVVNGAEAGPTLCITAGVHGTEYAGIDAAIKLSNLVKPGDLKGALIIVPVVNIIAFKDRSYICPIDGVNLQGSFPGKSDGTIGHLIAFKVFNNAISKADYWIDLHGGDVHESEIGAAHFYRTGTNEIDSKSEGMARALGFKYTTVSEGKRGEGASYRVGPEHGIPTALCELGTGDKLLKEESARVFQGVLNVMRYLKMLTGEPSKTEGQRIVETIWIGVNHAGLFYSNVKPGDILEKGEVIGEIKNLKGEVLETVRAPTKGANMLILHNPVVEPGGKVILSWGILEE
jgi:predicted deacylase